MKLLGEPFIIQNTSQGWLVTWNDAVRITSELDETLESVSFTVRLPRQANLTILEAQNFAMKRAEELLRIAIRHHKERGDQ